MKTKQLSFIIFLITFFIGTSYFFAWDYEKFLSQKQEIVYANGDIHTKLSSFSLNQISQTSWELHFVPDKKYLDILVKEISQAKKRIYINVYMLTEKNIRNALLGAKKRWLEIKIILEKNVYNSAGINNQTFSILASWSVDITRSSNDEYELDHAKYCIIDDSAIISTGNLTATTFTSNRDIFFETKDQTIVSDLTKVFLWDFEKKYIPIYNPSLAISPRYSRQKLENFLANAKSSIDIYMPYMNDTSLANILLSQAKKWVKVQIISDKNDEKDPFFSHLKEIWGKVTFQKRTIHAKSIIIDQKYLYLWSENFSTPSLDANKEVGIFLSNPALISQWEMVFKSDL